PGHLCRCIICDAATTICGRVSIKYLYKFLKRRAAKPIILIYIGGKVHSTHQGLSRPVPTQEYHYIVAVIIADQPLKALPVKVNLPQGGLAEIEVVEILDALVELGVVRVLQQRPVQLLVEGPLLLSAQLCTHKAQLLSRM